jgi:hypothetical protein
MHNACAMRQGQRATRDNEYILGSKGVGKIGGVARYELSLIEGIAVPIPPELKDASPNLNKCAYTRRIIGTLGRTVRT